MTGTKVSWLPWDEESFKKARELDRPILLGISAVWCHWCHVMDQTTYSDSHVAGLIEEKFVPIRVDRDRRPDVDKRYNMGGWPSTAFLTPGGEIITGGTYIPPQQMAALLEQVSQQYTKNKDNLKVRIKDLEKEKEIPSVENLDHEDFLSVIDDLTLAIASRFDSTNGGFGDAPKFPHTDALRLALLQYHLHGHKAALNIVKKTLTEMASGGIYDDVEGGFFRYSTTRNWSVPHYEKMSEDNAKLLTNYLEIYQVTSDEIFRETAKGILAYVDAKLRDQNNGGFFGSQDADEVYYKLNLSERQNRTPPRIDQTLFVNWNAMMASSYMLASTVLKDQTQQDYALKTLNLLLETAFSPKNGMSHYIVDGKSYLSGLLTDQVYTLKCLIDGYTVSFDRMFLEKAETLAEFMLTNLWDSNGGFIDKPKESGALGALKMSNKPLEENSVAADALLRLYHLTGKQDYLEAAKKTLEFFAASYQRYGIMGSVYGLAVMLYLYPMQIHVVGSRKEIVTLRFLKKCLGTYYPLKVVENIDPKQNSGRLKNLGYPIADVPVVYVCFGGTCSSVDDPEKIAETVRGKSYGK